MDDVSLETLWIELSEDCDAATLAADTANAIFAEEALGRLSGTGHYLSRFFNVFEQMALRVAKAFENNIDDEKGWHAELIRRMTLTLPGIRPALLTAEMARCLQHLRGFRHIFTHAYDLDLDPAQLALQIGYMDIVRRELPLAARRFVDGVAAMHSLTPP